MKKLLALLLVGMMIFSLAACGDNNTTDPDKDNPTPPRAARNTNHCPCVLFKIPRGGNFF